MSTTKSTSKSRHKYPMYFDGTVVPDHVNVIVTNPTKKYIGLSRLYGTSKKSLLSKRVHEREQERGWYRSSQSVNDASRYDNGDHSVVWRRSDYEPPCDHGILDLFLKVFKVDSEFVSDQLISEEWLPDEEIWLTPIRYFNHRTQSHQWKYTQINSTEGVPDSSFGNSPTNIKPIKIGTTEDLWDIIRYVGIDIQNYASDEQEDS